MCVVQMCRVDQIPRAVEMAGEYVSVRRAHVGLAVGPCVSRDYSDVAANRMCGDRDRASRGDRLTKFLLTDDEAVAGKLRDRLRSLPVVLDAVREDVCDDQDHEDVLHIEFHTDKDLGVCSRIPRLESELRNAEREKDRLHEDISALRKVKR